MTKQLTGDETTDKVKVIYVAGMPRSGSTILGRLLGELPGAVHVGELGLFTTPKFQAIAGCECRQSVAGCGFWQAVYECAGGFDSAELEALQATRSRYRLRTLPRLLLPKTPEQKRRLDDYLAALGRLYAAVQKVSGARVIVDGSKDPLYGYLLSLVPSVDLQVVHLVRDSRAVAFSHQRFKKYSPHRADSRHLPRSAPWLTALSWSATTLLLGAARSPRPALLRYEDFVADPAGAIRRLWEQTGEPLPQTDSLSEPVLHLQQGHTVAGNPDRYQSEVQIKPDVEWQAKMPVSARRMVTALTWPLLLRLGYFKPQAPEAFHPIQPSRVL